DYYCCYHTTSGSYIF
nr:immunoglobulin light chain junction region [Macaca mulatta]MOV69809.1 immunoglobulin light chain junction region [Macaca mulatta]MOV70228.1 immunoglobulin light chain junction region [Macaca mulatta]